MALACDEDGCRILNGRAGWLPHGRSKPQVGPVSRCSGRTAGSPLHTRSAGRGWRDSSRAAWSAPWSEGSPGENACYLRNLGTDEPLTSMNGMARGRATSSLSQNRQNRRNREPTRTGSRSGSCTDPRHRPTPRLVRLWSLAMLRRSAPLGCFQLGIVALALAGTMRCPVMPP